MSLPFYHPDISLTIFSLIMKSEDEPTRATKSAASYIFLSFVLIVRTQTLVIEALKKKLILSTIV